ncbi:hypothetical protein ACFSJY_17155 [Thalassotalea euphylliae]|uniref:hypothetical protein n=1 Tax=Thalassotalea euphylliae TaxID=1655234 RepID=UPI00363741B8
METLSVNGMLVPLADFSVQADDITNEYQGHFIKVTYSVEMSGHAVFSKDRVDIEPNGKFRFFIPPANLVIDEAVNLEIYAPSGELLSKQYCSHGSLKAASSGRTQTDNSKALEIQLNPKQVIFGEIAQVTDQIRKIKGRVVDLSGEHKNAGLQIIIYTHQGNDTEFSSDTFKAVMTAKTDKDGYFYGRAPNATITQAVGLVAGLDNTPIAIPLDENKLPANVILATDLSSLSDDLSCGCEQGTESLPDGADLVNSSAFSQDVGGTCVDFTVPNRTLEEFSFYQTVRTTEPEIRGLTIRADETQKIRKKLVATSDLAFGVLAKLKSSLGSMSLLNFSVDEGQPISDESNTKLKAFRVNADRNSENDNATGHDTNMAQPMQPIVASRMNYVFKLDIGQDQPFALNSLEITSPGMRFNYSDIIQLILAQNKRKQRLKELHQKLAAAYCGKNGVQEEKSFCEQLAEQAGLDKEELSSILGHIKKNITFVDLDGEAPKLARAVIFDIEKLINGQQVDAKQIKATATQLEKLIHAVDSLRPDSQGQEMLLGNLRRVAIELANNLSHQALGFEPCPIAPVRETMGIMCLMQKYEQIKNLLSNTRILSLQEIIEIRDYYQIFLDSITAFIRLLDEYYNFYNSGINFNMEVLDRYFYDNYEEIKSTLIQLQREIARSRRYVEVLEQAYIRNHPGRRELSVETSIDWDETPTVYENTTIAHGHILHFKQQWKADGYSLGDLLYSLPLAPCQEKKISILDWDRQEQARRDEAQLVTEDLTADISRERDISEIMSANLNENMQAKSTNKTSSTSAGIGGGLGGFIKPIVFGIAGGVAHSGASSTTTASQSSSRNLASSAMSRLQDSTSQSASSVRSQRNTVVQTVTQNETVTAQTEVVKNNNHCHAMTVEYFEVLKHYAVEQNLVDVQECLFVPMPMSHFDHDKVMRWRHTLERTIYGRTLRRGFGAIERIETNYVNADMPTGSYADDPIMAFDGYLTMSFELSRPFNPVIDSAMKMERYDLSVDFPWFGGEWTISTEIPVPLSDEEKDALFEEKFAPDIVRRFVDTLAVYAVNEHGTQEELDLDLTLLSTYRRGAPLRIGIASGSIQTITRRRIQHLVVRAKTEVKSSSKIILRSMNLGYRTQYIRNYVVRNSRINNDIIFNGGLLSVFFPPEIAELLGATSDAAQLYTPMNQRELANPRKEDQEAASALVQFLNEHMELSHKIIWSSIDASRLFSLLDGYIAPNSNGRSVASVVENKVMGVVGNNLVLKVIPGERLDPVFRSVEDLLTYYQPTTRPDPYRISVPTKGVYAESVMGKCNSCEPIDESRHWRFEDVPCCGEAPSIDAISMNSRRQEPGSLQVKDLPANIVNVQSAPAAPDPTGLAEAYKLLGQGDAFRDITGVAGTQKNAIDALNTTSKQVTDLASISKDFANLALMGNQKRDGAKQIEQIKKLNKDGYLTDKEASEQIKEVLSSYNDASKNITKAKDGDKGSVAKQIAEKVVKTGLSSPDQEVEYTKSTPEGETESIKVSKPDASAHDSAKPIIILRGDSAEPETRAFKPFANDKSLAVHMSADYKNAPNKSRLRWSSATPGALSIDNPTAKNTTVRGVIPGLHGLDLELFDPAGNVIASTKIMMSVPQCVTINEEEAEFDDALTTMQMTGQKTAIVREMKATAGHLLANANVRLIWQLNGETDAVPAHVPANMVVSAVVRNSHPTLLGVTTGSVSGDRFNESIELYPASYLEPSNLDVDTETQALTDRISNDVGADSALVDLGAIIFGRLIGETLSHEVGHALLWDDIPGDRHNNPVIADDIMNAGHTRSFTNRTGFENTQLRSPIQVSDFTDHGLTRINSFQANNLQLLDDQWPVPPAFN